MNADIVVQPGQHRLRRADDKDEIRLRSECWMEFESLTASGLTPFEALIGTLDKYRIGLAAIALRRIGVR